MTIQVNTEKGEKKNKKTNVSASNLQKVTACQFEWLQPKSNLDFGSKQAEKSIDS